MVFFVPFVVLASSAAVVLQQGISRWVGWRFAPTETELIAEYLEKKIRDENDSSLPEVRLNDFDEPQRLFDEASSQFRSMLEWCPPEDNYTYFIYRRAANEQKPRGTGHWSHSGKWQTIEKDGREIGEKRSRPFRRNGSSRRDDQKWTITEYCSCSNRREQDKFRICRLEKKGANIEETLTDTRGDASTSNTTTPQSPIGDELLRAVLPNSNPALNNRQTPGAVESNGAGNSNVLQSQYPQGFEQSSSTPQPLIPMPRSHQSHRESALAYQSGYELRDGGVSSSLGLSNATVDPDHYPFGRMDADMEPLDYEKFFEDEPPPDLSSMV